MSVRALRRVANKAHQIEISDSETMFAGGVDVSAAAAAVVFPTATTLTIGGASTENNFSGDLNADGGIDRSSAAALDIAGSGANATSVNLGTGDAVTGVTVGGGAGYTGSTIGKSGETDTILGDLVINGNLTIAGDAFQGAVENSAYADNHLYLNAGYETTSAQTAGLVANYLPLATNDTVAATGFVAGIAATSNPTVATTGAATFSVGQLIQISGADNANNNGVFEVLSHAANLLTIRGVGTTATVEDFTNNQFTTDTTVAGTIRQVSVSVMRSGVDGLWETAQGSVTGLTFADLATAAGSTLQSAYSASGAPATITTDATNDEFTVAGTAGLYVTGTGADNATAPVGFGFVVDTTGAYRLDSDAASNMNVTGANLDVTTTTSGAINVSSAGALNLDSASDASINSSAGNVNVANDAVAQTVNVATGAAAKTVNIGSQTGASSVTIDSGTGAINVGTGGQARSINIGTGAAAQTLVFGSTDTTSSVTINAGTGNIDIGTTAQARTANFATGGAAQTVTVGSTNGASSMTIDAGTGTISIGGSASARAINIGTGAAAQTVAVGSQNGASSLTLDSGTGNINIGTGAQARSINVGTGAAAQTVVVGSQTAGSATTIDSGTGNINIGTTIAKTIAIGNTTGATALDFDAGTGGVSINATAGGDIALTVASDAASDVTFAAHGSGAIPFNSATAGQTTLNGSLPQNVIGAINTIFTGSSSAGVVSNAVTAGAALAIGQCVYTTTTDDRVDVTDVSTDTAASEFIGICTTAAASAGDPVTVATQGLIDVQVEAATYVSGDAIYLSAATNGRATRTAPSASGNVVFRIGFAQTDIGVKTAGQTVKIHIARAVRFTLV